MARIDDLRVEIEGKRTELNHLYEEGDFNKYFEKSKELDKLLEEYIDLDGR